MRLSLTRKIFQEKCTIGELTIEGDDWTCFTLEDVIRNEKVAHETAIPDGTYKMYITWSPRFKRQLPLIVEVQGFDGIRIHPGNTDQDTDGCILVGDSYGEDWISNSKVTFDKLYEKLLTDRSNLTIDIV